MWFAGCPKGSPGERHRAIWSHWAQRIGWNLRFLAVGNWNQGNGLGFSSFANWGQFMVEPGKDIDLFEEITVAACFEGHLLAEDHLNFIMTSDVFDHVRGLSESGWTFFVFMRPSKKTEGDQRCSWKVLTWPWVENQPNLTNPQTKSSLWPCEASCFGSQPTAFSDVVKNEAILTIPFCFGIFVAQVLTRAWAKLWHTFNCERSIAL